MLNDDDTLLPLETVSLTVLLIESQTPAAPRTDQTMNTDTTVTMPKAIDSRNDTFITDQGSIRLSRRRARRGARAGPDGVRRAVAAVAAGADLGADGAGAGTGWAARSWGRGCAGRAWGCSGCPERPVLGPVRSAGRALCWASSGGGGGSTRAGPPLRCSSEAAEMRRWSRSARGIRAVS